MMIKTNVLKNSQTTYGNFFLFSVSSFIRRFTKVQWSKWFPNKYFIQFFFWKINLIRSEDQIETKNLAVDVESDWDIRQILKREKQNLFSKNCSSVIDVLIVSLFFSFFSCQWYVWNTINFGLIMSNTYELESSDEINRKNPITREKNRDNFRTE